MSQCRTNGDFECKKRLGEPIAIIGSGCRFPGCANTPQQLWELLEAPRDVSSALPASRFNAAGFYHRDGSHHGHANVKQLRGYFLSGEGVERRFDANFFGINAVEANVLDPQMRLLLEVTYEALDVAGLSLESLRGSDTGCYVGLMSGEYEQAMLRDPENIGTYHAVGTARSFMSNRLSYFFDWHGPSMTIDTACSSSLVAVHQAVQLLRSHQSRVAVAAGSNMIMDPTNYISESKLQMLSPDGESRMWDASANGYARGEGVCTIVMKRLEDAIADGDFVECVIRETGCNSDGRTQGITRPSATAQEQLIRHTYTSAGLDPGSARDRPQYFEAHGTGTAAGDPVEAEAIHAALFAGAGADDGQLLVGSIKTVVGHTEGTAGVAGVLKASLALQKGFVPGNLLFQSLNPRVEPFAKHLQLALRHTPWPAIEPGQPRRASVNSFGFGGTNAHAILESFDNTNTAATMAQQSKGGTVFMPFVFSAVSSKSLRNYLRGFVSHVERNMKDLKMRDVAYTLLKRRSRLPYAISLPAADGPELLSRLQHILERADTDGNPVGIRASTSVDGLPTVIGIFTGQGAQWSAMGSELLKHSTVASDIIARLEERLALLPEADRPDWSLRAELQRVNNNPKMNKARYAQPLCTAIQILLVQLIRSAGLTFSAVVGHSSGEIAAAYAAGVLSAEDAICIAYYRGLHTKLAGGHHGKPGAMLVVGTSVEDVSDVLESGSFQARVSIAAINSSSSVTLSGDQDAVEELQAIFEDEDKFVRLLLVEKAYHSHHMARAAKYLRQSILQLNINVTQDSLSECVWISSVSGRRLHADAAKGLQCEYWVENLLSPVLFMQAVEEACSIVGRPSAVVEIGPHPALRSPVQQTLREVFKADADLPYAALLRRGSGAVASVAEGLGQLWLFSLHPSIDIQAYDQFISGSGPFNLDRTLPPYAWDHDSHYWHDSRLSRAYLRREREHELLGHLTEIGDDFRQWHQILCPKETSWLGGHRLQGQIVFPAAGYVVLAIEAAMQYVHALPKPCAVSLVEVHRVEISQAMTFHTEDARVEALFRLYDIVVRNDRITANFHYSGLPVNTAPPDGPREVATRTWSTGCVTVTLGAPSSEQLPARSPAPFNTLPVRKEDFYESLARVGFEYSGPFYALDGLHRRLGRVKGKVLSYAASHSDLIIHPATLDAAFQAVLLALAAPYDGALWSLHVPRKIRRIIVNPVLCSSKMIKSELLPLDAYQSTKTRRSQGDVDIYPASEGERHAMCQVEGLECVPIAPASAKDDKDIFATMEWGPAFPDACLASEDLHPSPGEVHLGQLLERMSQFYLQNLERAIPSRDPLRQTSAIGKIFQFAQHIDSLNRSRNRDFWKPEWHEDTHETIADAMEPFKDNVDVRLLKRIGENLMTIAKGQITAIEIAMKDHLLNEVYTDSLGLKQVTQFLARIIVQMTHRCPQMSVLEVGGGTGGATKAIFSATDIFGLYTFTDVSPAFFPAVQEALPEHSSKMEYRVLDVGKDPAKQGFELHSYDAIVASMVLHVTTDLRQTMRNIRSLLRPGGYLIVQEGFTNNVGRTGAIFGAFPDWWLGAEDGRDLGPLVSIAEWHAILCETGFSGIDTCSPTSSPFSHPTAVFVSQRVDDRICYIRDPTSAPLEQSRKLHYGEVVMVGGRSQKTEELMMALESTFRPRFQQVRKFQSFAQLASAELIITSTTLLLSLTELDQPLLQDIDTAEFEGAKATLLSLGSILWITQGSRAINPFAATTVGMVRGVVCEVPTLTSQFLDIECARYLTASTIATAFLRFAAQVAMAKKQEGGQPTAVTLERELVLDDRGCLLVPRLKPNRAMNDRYNSNRRVIYKDARIGVGELNISLKPQPSTAIYNFEELSEAARLDYQCRPTHSLLQAVRVSNQPEHAYLSFSNDAGGSQHLLLSSQLAPQVSATQSAAITTKILSEMKPAFLVLAAQALVCLQIFQNTSRDEMVVAFAASPLLAKTLLALAQHRQTQVILVGVTPDPINAGDHYREINPWSPERVMNDLLPLRKSIFLDCTENEDGSPSRAAARIMGLRANYYRYQAWGDFSSRSGSARSIPVSGITQQQMAAAVDHALHCITGNTIPLSSLKLRILAGSDLSAGAIEANDSSVPSIVDWTRVSKIKLKVQSIETKVRFSSNKTYWLAGLSGGLGLSLCEWMIAQGAKHIVITSRNPTVSAGWLGSIQALSAKVVLLPCDLTDETQVHQIYKRICAEMPPLGGLAQGAMVLHDTGFHDMSSEIMERVLRPKVAGSINLDRLLKGVALDFFVFFSSATAIIGNAGQANYSAANLFMTSLAQQRRQRGEAASIIHIGPILGVGYVTQQGETVRDIFARQGEYTFMSETDFHQLFAEAVAAGYPGSKLPLEISMGIAKLRERPAKDLKWYLNPLSAHMTGCATAEVASKSSTARASVKSMLEKATTEVEVFEALKDAFLPVLCSLFQLDQASTAELHFLDNRLDMLGIDSLLAVELRAWWLDTLQVNIPVMKILSGTTIKDIIRWGLEGLRPELIPNVSGAVAAVREDEQPNGEKADNSESASHARQLPALVQTMPMSFQQELYWFGLTSTQDRTALNHTTCYRIKGRLRIDDLERAILHVAQACDAFRMCFRTSDGQTTVGVTANCSWQPQFRKIMHESEVDTVVEEMHNSAYDLEYGETMRIVVLSVSDTEHYMVCGTHSLILDGLSSVFLLRQISQLYENFSSFCQLEPYQHSEWIRSQLSTYAEGGFDQSLKDLKACWADLPPPLPILRVSSRKTRPQLADYGNYRADALINKAVKSRILSQPSELYLRDWPMWKKWSLVSVTPIGLKSTQPLPWGAFANIVPIRSSNSTSQRFSDVLKDSCTAASSAMQHSDVPFHLLLGELNVPRSTTHTPMFQAFIDYRQGMRKTQKMGDCELELLSFQASKIPYDICLDIIDDAEEGDCVLHLIVRSDLYTQEEAQMLVGCFVKLAESYCRVPHVSLASAAMFGTEEIKRALQYGQGKLPTSQGRTVFDLIKLSSDAMSSAPALKSASASKDTMTYLEMERTVETVARAIMAQNIGKGSIVAIYQDRDPNWVCSLLGIMSAGCICLPLDVSLPLSRLVAILQHSKPGLLLAQSTLVADSLLRTCVASKTQVLIISELLCGHMNLVDLDSGQFAWEQIQAKDPAIILYTSGSTGTPKGIVLRHEGLRNWTEAAIDHLDITRGDVVLQQTSCSFDFCFIQMFLALCSGGLLCIVPTASRADATFITRTIEGERITFTGATPTEYSNWHHYGDHAALSRSLLHWRTALSGGEPVPTSMLHLFASLRASASGQNGPRLFNGYGPTETTASATGTELYYHGEIEQSSISVGRPLPGYLVYVVDEQLQPVPVGCLGEIVIGGAGVAECYLHDQELTSQRFMVDQLAPQTYRNRGWTMMHRTGDLGRWTRAGTLLVEGRKSGDTQIKLRGLRIDLAEIEHCMLKDARGMLDHVVVSLRSSGFPSPQPHEEFLVAHVKFRSDVLLSADGQKGFLDELLRHLSLPSYMRPAAAIAVKYLPMMNSGKLDRKALAALPLEQEDSSRPGRLPDPDHGIALNETEQRLKRLWELCISGGLAKQHSILPSTDFFHVGGNSTLLLKLRSEIQKEFNVSLQLLDMFKHTTLGAMAEMLSPGASNKQDATPAVDWSTETKVPEVIQMSLRSARQVDAVRPEVVILTGATGSMGQSYLRALVADASIRTVHCIAIRPDSARFKHALSQPDSLLRHPKVEYHLGDISQPDLGMDEAAIIRVFNSADCIIHNAADTSHMKTYESLRNTNLASTQEIVKLCLNKHVRRMIPIHYVSTGSVWSSSGLEVAEEASAAAYPPRPKLSTGYSASKWASEVFLENVFELSKSCWSICIHRPASVRPNASQDGDLLHSLSGNAPTDLTQILLDYCQITRSIPSSSRLRGYINQVSLSTVTEHMMAAIRSHRQALTAIRYIHEVGDLDFRLDQLSDIFPDAEKVEAQEWLKRAAAQGLAPIMATFLSHLVDDLEIAFPFLARSGSSLPNGHAGAVV
ncbi:hypothetical protein AC578_8117 [Pseudocercospora eumusae]|uniref:Carrier domain-containing protein n=1 Tax=Pseudocercospora eumusae TaxID=321146 RepID=A0A139GV36_9PEZI|nr:hypothetical protein AC578_8117 [Pseudocercospora eumusae]